MKWNKLTQDSSTWPAEDKLVLWHWWSAGDVSAGMRKGNQVFNTTDDEYGMPIKDATYWAAFELPTEFRK